jgi:hypothetical protein
MPGKKLKFPVPRDYPAKDPVVLCPTERVIGLYKQATGKTTKRIAKKITEWFAAEAKKHEWADCRFLPTVQSRHSAGCILLNPNSKSVVVSLHQITINLPKNEM